MYVWKNCFKDNIFICIWQMVGITFFFKEQHSLQWINWNNFILTVLPAIYLEVQYRHMFYWLEKISGTLWKQCTLRRSWENKTGDDTGIIILFYSECCSVCRVTPTAFLVMQGRGCALISPLITCGMNNKDMDRMRETIWALTRHKS